MTFIPVTGWVNPRALVQLEGLGKLKKKNPMISSGIEPVTFRHVAQCRNRKAKKHLNLCTIAFLSLRASKWDQYVSLTFNLQAVSLSFPTGLRLQVFQLWSSSEPDIVVTEVEVVFSMVCYVPYRPRVTTTLPPSQVASRKRSRGTWGLQGVSPRCIQCESYRQLHLTNQLIAEKLSYPINCAEFFFFVGERYLGVCYSKLK
jgi:hypothetical protein